MKPIKRLLGLIKAPFGKVGHSPEYDWHVALGFFAMGFVIVLITSIVSFVGLSSSTEGEGDSQSTPTVKINKEDITKAIKNTEQRDINALYVPDVIQGDPSSY